MHLAIRFLFEEGLTPPAGRTDMAGDCKFCVVMAAAVCTIFLSSLEADAHEE